MAMVPGSGEEACSWPEGCGNREIEGLEFCLHHVPDELLEEAEEITGFYRCRERFGQPDECRYYAVRGTEPPRCKNHGANRGSSGRLGATVRVVEGKITDRLAALLAEGGERLMNPPPIGNPLEELLELAAEIKAIKDMMRAVTAYLYDQKRIRSAHAKVGEQTRAEVLIYERASERLAMVLTNIARLNIADRLVAIERDKADMLERAVDAALRAAGVPPERMDVARQVLRRELKVVA